MDIEITNFESGENLRRFQAFLHNRPGGKKGTGSREYTVLFNRHTGEMRFAKKIFEIEGPLSKMREGSPRDWKQVRIIVTDESVQASHFKVLDEKNRELDAFDPNEIDKTALRVAKETIAVLNKKADAVQNMSAGTLLEVETLRDLSCVHVRPQGKEIEKLPGWAGLLTRKEAEEKLMKEKIGAYLIRAGDRDTDLTVQFLAEANRTSIEYYILTFKPESQKISEDLILCVNGGWILYKDEPILNSPQYTVFSTPADLLKSIAGANYPLQFKEPT